MRSFIRLWGMAVLGLSLAGCASQQVHYSAAVDSLASPNASLAKSYVLTPGNKGVTTDDLQYQEFAGYVDRVLQQHGFVHAPTPDQSDMVIVLIYGIGDPQTHQYSYALPIFGQTGVASAQTTGTATSVGSSTYFSGSTTYTPSFGVTGYIPQTGTVTTYFRYVDLTAFDSNAYRTTQKLVELWDTKVTSTGTSGDLRLVFPILIAAASPYIAVNSGNRIEVSLTADDKQVLAVKGLVGQK